MVKPMAMPMYSSFPMVNGKRYVPQAPTGRPEDAMPDDGPISVAFGLRPNVGPWHSSRPCPATEQYIHRGESEMLEMMMQSQPRRSCNVQGFVQAAVNDAADMTGLNAEDLAMTGVKHNALRLIYASISGWTLNFWASQEDFQASFLPYGARPGGFAPGPTASWDLHQAYDVDFDVGNHRVETCAHRVRVMMYTGNLYFRVEQPEDVPVWIWALRSLIQDASWEYVKRRDKQSLQMKRWPAARGVARALFSGSPIGERALAMLFHCYDIDSDCTLRTGEIMLLIQELLAGRFANDDKQDCLDRDTVVWSASSHLPQAELYERAVRLRKVCCPTCSRGRMRKDDFLTRGHAAMLEAFGLPIPFDMSAGAMTGQEEDVCAVM